MQKKDYDYVIVGGGISGGFASFSIRKHDKRGSIALVGAEPHLPYDRVPLSKEFVRWERPLEELFFKREEFYRRNKVDLYRGHLAVKLNRMKREIVLDDGGRIGYEKLLLATGGRPRKLDIPGSHYDGIFYLRNLEDSIAIRQRIPLAKKAVVVGGGFIGCELAASLTTRGIETTIIEVMPHILGRAIDQKTSEWLKKYHESKGTKVITQTSVIGFQGENGRVTGVKTSDNKLIQADLVAIGAGIVLNLNLAEDAGLKVENGVVVNQKLRSNDSHIFAAGDIARFYSPLLDRYMRVEHYDVAEKHGTIAGANMTGEQLEYDEPPYFFSDQYDISINAFGDLSKPTRIVTKGRLSSKGFIEYYLEGNKLAAILSINGDWDEIEKAKAKIGTRVSM
ncbi:MAG: FAD-dependent oxidoreductase [Nitrososphaerota archaeon]|jgi:3-phenylpropionate/trans-cinnamate dioxygenase ferredoxin reductase subunit|nr:FAD-dependent oxidoreductase [Nitrososphaerota archaeon]